VSFTVPRSREPVQPTIPNARAFVRSFNVLLKFARLYGLGHRRSVAQMESAWSELQECLNACRETGLLLGVSGSQLLLDGEPLESTAAERSFADLLTAGGIASIGFTNRVHKDEFADLVRMFAESGAKAGTLGERLEASFGARSGAGIRVNGIRFVAEDGALSETRLAAQLAAKTLGADGKEFRDWFRSPEKMIQLIAAAEGSRGTGSGATAGGSGSGQHSAGSSGSGVSGGAGTAAGKGTGWGTGTGSGSGVGSGWGSGGGSSPNSGVGIAGSDGGHGGGQGSGASASAPGGAGLGGAAGVSGGLGEGAFGVAGPKGLSLSEADIHGLLRLLVQFGEAAQPDNPAALPQQVWQEKLAALPHNAQLILRQALANIAAKTPNVKVDETVLLRLAEDLAIQFALDQFERGEVRINAVRQMLDRMGREVENLRKLLRAREDKLAKAGVAVESQADVLDRQFWAAVPESGKRNVLTSPEAWCVPPRNVQQYVDELLTRGESEIAGNVLSKYASCVRSKDPEARKKAAIGLGQLAALYSKTASEGLKDALAQTGQQMLQEKDPELQTLLSAAFVRLSQESASRRFFPAVQQALDSLADLEEHRPNWVQNLRPRTGIENRIPEFLEEALAAEAVPEGFLGVLMRLPETAAEQLAIRLARSGRRTERETVVQMAQAIGPPCKRQLMEILKNSPPQRAVTAVGLSSRLDPHGTEEILCGRLREGGRTFHDAIVRQLGAAGAPERGRILGSLIASLDRAAVPFALDEMGMCGDVAVAPKLLQIARGELLAEGSGYAQVKAIEALGRLRAPEVAEHLRPFVESRRRFGWAYPEEIRTAAAQALMKLDPEWMEAFSARSGLDSNVLSLAPLDPLPGRDVVRYRRYRRVRLPRHVPALVVSPRGKCSSAISVLSLEGGLLNGDVQLAVGTEATLKIPAGIRPISLQAVVRFVRSHQAGFETVSMELEDRTKLRRLLVSLGGDRNSASGVDPKTGTGS
jgi:PilZ domain